MTVSALRIVARNRAAERSRASYVLYWMIGARRLAHNAALEHALSRAAEHRLPLLIVEPLRVDYRWASARLHAFVLQGMADNAAACARAGVTYWPYVEPERGAGKGLLAELARHAAVVVTDEQPGFFLPHMVQAAARKLDVRLVTVDGCGVLPLRAAEREYPTAALFRRHLQRHVGRFLLEVPEPSPLHGYARGPAQVPAEVVRRWPAAAPALLTASPAALRALAIDHSVAPVAERGGAVAATAALRTFLQERLSHYHDARNQPEREVASGLSPYLHFGHLSVHQVVAEVAAAVGWEPSRLLGAKVTGSREGFWGLPPAAESFFDELLTWREVGHGFAFHRADYDRYESLPAWAQKSLEEHASDPRSPCYSPAQLEAAATADPLWNAAQRQLCAEGKIHNYLRMLWGKKILEWTESPRQALQVMIELNNKYALDGRDPNSYSGIFWTLGRFDRPWAPIRPIFGCIRYMSSTNTARKVSVKGYVARYATPQQTLALG